MKQEEETITLLTHSSLDPKRRESKYDWLRGNITQGTGLNLAVFPSEKGNTHVSSFLSGRSIMDLVDPVSQPSRS